jgi:TolA-binding protein
MNKIANIFAPTDCISEEILVKYICNQLSPAEKHAVEKHLADCEMCADAVEGFSERAPGDIQSSVQLVEDKKKISAILLELNKKIQTRAKKKRIGIIYLRSYRTRLAVAASVIGILGLIIFFRSNRDSKEAPAGKIFADKLEPSLYENKERTSAPENPPGRKQAEVQPKIVSGKHAETNTPGNAPGARAIRPREEVKVRRSDVSRNQTHTYFKGAPPAYPAQSSERQPAVFVPDSVSSLVTMEEAMNKYEEKDYAGAISDFEQLLKQKPADEKALFYSAVSYLGLEQTEKAIVNLIQVMQNQNSEYYDPAQWHLSQAYLKKKDIKNARTNLLQIQNNFKSRYRKEAGEALKEMQK